MAVAPALEQTTEQILDATDRVIGRFGLRKATMEDVAKEAGLSRRTIYEYFPSKQDLALASIDRVVARAQAEMAREAANEHAAPERLYRMLIARVMVRVRSVRDISQSLDSMFAVIRPAYFERRQRYFQEEAAMIAEVIRQGKASRAFGGADAQDTASLLVQATNAFLPYSLSVEELGRPDEIQERVEKLAAILVSGISR